MAYLDNWDVRTKPQYWTAAIYQQVPGGRGYVFKGYIPTRQMKWGDFLQYRMDNYSNMRGYATYPFYWDPLGKVWMRDSGRPAVAGELDVGKGDFATVFPGWNVWSVYQVKDLPFSPMMLGVSKERQLRIWVEDQVRLHAPGAVVADSIDLKGGQVEILPSKQAVEGLHVAERKEQVGGPVLLVEGPADLFYVRFFNRGVGSQLSWPHDGEYLLNEVFMPSDSSPATSGPAPTTITQGVGEPVKAVVTPLLWAGGLLLGFLTLREFRK